MRTSGRRFVRALVGGVALVFLGATAGVALESHAVRVSVGSGDVTIQPNPVPHFAAMNVQIVDPAGQFVVSTQSLGEAVTWVPSPGAPDGEYRYEAVVVTVDPHAPDNGNPNNPAGVAAHRSAGSFVVSGGQIVPPVSSQRQRQK